MNYINIIWCISIFSFTYKYRYTLLLNFNYYFKKFYQSLNTSQKFQVKILSSSYINNANWYKYSINKRIYYTKNKKDLEIDSKDYQLFLENNMLGICTPENIIMTELFLKNKDKFIDETVDILEDIQSLCGPYVDKITEAYKDDIKEYLNEFKKYTDISKLFVLFSNGKEITLNF